MKNFYIICLILLGLIILSCSDTITDSPPSETGNKEQIIRISDTEIAVVKTIDGSVGGSILLNTIVLNPQNDSILITASLEIEPGSFQGTEEIQMIPNFSDASVRFFPAKIFDKDLCLTLTFQGIDLASLGFTPNSKGDFVYMYDNGEIEPVSYSSIVVNGSNKFIKVVNAKLSHFSRYVFLR